MKSNAVTWKGNDKKSEDLATGERGRKELKGRGGKEILHLLKGKKKGARLEERVSVERINPPKNKGKGRTLGQSSKT